MALTGRDLTKAHGRATQRLFKNQLALAAVSMRAHFEFTKEEESTIWKSAVDSTLVQSSSFSLLLRQSS